MFVKYNSIENSYRERSYDNAFYHQEAADTLWNVTEKLDGTNFSFVVTADDIKPAKRSGLIHENEKFFGFQEIFLPLVSKARSLYDNLSYLTESGLWPSVVQIYGEYVGKGILNRVDYKEKCFYVFDIKVDGVFLDSDDVEKLCEKYGFKHVPVLFVGSVDQVKQFHDDWLKKEFNFNSTITLDEDHGILFTEKEVTNASEGFVIKPNKPLYEHTGSRVILKCKSAKFNETKTVKMPKKHVDISEKDNNVLGELSTYITQSRIFSVLSKFGELGAKDFSKVLKLFVVDVKEQYEQDNSTELYKECDNVSNIIQELNKLCACELRTDWLNLIDKSKE